MEARNVFDITPQQYHAALDMLWEALCVDGPQKTDVFTLAVERIATLEAALREIDRLERVSSYERCPDCDTQCTRETGCLVVYRLGGTLVQKAAAKAMGGRT
jgi:hypothetical protein